MTSVHSHITRCPTKLQAIYPDLPHPLLSARRSGLLSCLHETKRVLLKLQTRHRFRIRQTFWSTRHTTAAFATAMDSSAPHHIEILEGSQLQERPDSTNEIFLYTHVLCPYAQTAWLTLLQLVRKLKRDYRLTCCPEDPSDHPSVSFANVMYNHIAGCAASSGTYRLIKQASMVHTALQERRLLCHCSCH